MFLQVHDLDLIAWKFIIDLNLRHISILHKNNHVRIH